MSEELLIIVIKPTFKKYMYFKIFIYFTYLFDCASSQLWPVGSLLWPV